MPLGVVKLDRMAIEEAGPDPERIAASIHMQLALLSGPSAVPEGHTRPYVGIAPLKNSRSQPGKPAPAVMSNSTTNPQPWCLASTALSAMSNGNRIFRPFYISLDSAYPNSRLRSTSPACPPTRKPTLATGWCGLAVTP